jgi:hypothetical protein
MVREMGRLEKKGVQREASGLQAPTEELDHCLSIVLFLLTALP